MYYVGPRKGKYLAMSPCADQVWGQMCELENAAKLDEEEAREREAAVAPKRVRRRIAAAKAAAAAVGTVPTSTMTSQAQQPSQFHVAAVSSSGNELANKVSRLFEQKMSVSFANTNKHPSPNEHPIAKANSIVRFHDHDEASKSSAVNKTRLSKMLSQEGRGNTPAFTSKFNRRSMNSITPLPLNTMT